MGKYLIALDVAMLTVDVAIAIAMAVTAKKRRADMACVAEYPAAS